jgi:hypothetical protein
MNVALRFVQCDHAGSKGTEAVALEFPLWKVARAMTRAVNGGNGDDNEA